MLLRILHAKPIIAIARTSDREGQLPAILDSARRPGSAGRSVLLAVVMLAPTAALRGQDAKPPVLPADIATTILAAKAQKNFDQLDEAARAAISLRLWAVGQKLLEASLSISEGKSGRQSVDYGVGLSHLGDLEQRQGQKTALASVHKSRGRAGQSARRRDRTHLSRHRSHWR